MPLESIGPFLVEVPPTRLGRMRGLLGRRGLPPGHGMLFERARSVHTFGMRFPILAVFLDDGYRVLEARVVPPGRFARSARARHVLEVGVGEVVRTGRRLDRRRGRRPDASTPPRGPVAILPGLSPRDEVPIV